MMNRPPTLVTQRIIRLLVKQRAINRSQIADLLLEAADAHSAESTRPCADTIPSAIQPDSREVRPAAVDHSTTLDDALCHAVFARLLAFGNRIEERGRAAMLPCTTKLPPAFLGPLRCLASSVALLIARPIDGPLPALMARG